MPEISKTAFGIGIISIFESQVFPFMLSSAFTARTAVKNNNQEDKVKDDIVWAVGISIAFSILLAYLINDWASGIYGILFAILLMAVYEYRGELI